MANGISRRRAETRARLLAAALEVFAREGIAGASIEMIADAAGFSRGAFYSNFSSKEELFLELAKQQIEERIDVAALAVQDLAQNLFKANSVDAAAVGSLIRTIIQNDAAERQWHMLIFEFELFALRNPEQGRAIIELQEGYLKEVALVLIPLLESAGVHFLGDPQISARVMVMGYLEASRHAFLTPDIPFDEAISRQMEWFAALADKFVIPGGELGEDNEGQAADMDRQADA